MSSSTHPLRFAALLAATLLAPIPLAATTCAPTDGGASDGNGGATGSATEARAWGPPDIDSARAEMAVGRYWHAARHLRALREGGTEFGPEELLLLARAEAGYRHWAGVRDALEGQPWLASLDGGAGLRLLGRALEGGEAWAEAADAYGRWLDTEDGRGAADAAAIRARRARSLAQAGRPGPAAEALDALAGSSPVIASWAALDVAERLAPRGDTALVRRLVSAMTDGEARGRAWELPAVATLAAGDTAGALEAYGVLATAAGSASRRARSHAVMGELRLAKGHRSAAVEHFRQALDLAADGSGGVAAARHLVDLGALEADRALAAARSLAGAGQPDRALKAYDLLVARDALPSSAEEVRLARARLLATTEGRHEEAVAELRALSTSQSVEIGATALDVWTDLRRRQGRADDVRTLREWLVERYPASPQAANFVFLRGDAAQDRLELDAAIRDYERVGEMAPTSDRAGLARMRAAQIHLLRGDSARALAGFRAYADAFPDGRRWDEATYWAGVVQVGMGRDQEGRAALRSVMEREPLSYYALLSARALDVEWTLPGGTGGGLPTVPDWIAAELALIEALAEAGLESGRAARTSALTERALAASDEAALRLARELIERDQGLDGINLGWELRRRGMPWSRALLEVTYPFPYREMVHRVARERGLDPLFVASVIRQESAFDPDIVSHAGAVGLMQIMPATGEQLASAVGPEDFDPESLVTPEINLHLGTRYLVDLSERYDGRLPLMLSAYNAGPHRADAWMDFREAVDPLRFTERIPYGETRDYVKQITRNIALYEALYGRPPAS